MPDGILVEHRRILDLSDVLLVLEIGVREHDRAQAVGFGKHALELDLGKARVRLGGPNRLPYVRDIRLATSWPALGPGARGRPHGAREFAEIRTYRFRRRQRRGTA